MLSYLLFITSTTNAFPSSAAVAIYLPSGDHTTECMAPKFGKEQRVAVTFGTFLGSAFCCCPLTADCVRGSCCGNWLGGVATSTGCSGSLLAGYMIVGGKDWLEGAFTMCGTDG